ncbi:MAG: PorT family protein [Sphingobacteriales bacterium]|nr:PorT family protein [Sphingobacteriales bacterium]MBI3717920.1 PorT family protein [Sphingobacteriales bacterium]
MRKLLLTSFIILCFLHSQSQVSLGLKAGVNFANEKLSNNIYSSKSHAFFGGGVFGNFGLSKNFAIDLSLLHSGEGYKESYMSNGTEVTGVVTINRLNIPLLLQYKTRDGFFAETGPQAGFLLSAKGKYSNNPTAYDFKSNTNSLLFSWCIGAGYKLNKNIPGLGIEALYAPGLSKVNKGTANAGKITASNISVRLLYSFSVQQKKK